MKYEINYSYKVFVMHKQIIEITKMFDSLEAQWAYAEAMYKEFCLSKYNDYDCLMIDAMNMFLQSNKQRDGFDRYKEEIKAIKKIISESGEKYTDGECIDLIWDVVHPKK